MPVLDHEVSECTKLNGKLYKCNNAPRPVAGNTYIAQNGWQWVDIPEIGSIRVPIPVSVPHVMSTECRYDLAEGDDRCAGCRYILSGKMHWESYRKKVAAGIK